MKRSALLLSVSLLLTACHPASSGEAKTTAELTMQTTTTTPDTGTQSVQTGNYTLLSQYLAGQPSAKHLKNCRMLGGGTYLLCFENEEDTYEIEYTSLAHGRECYTASADNVHTAADGFWVLNSVTEDSAAAMEWNGVKYSGLSIYSNSLGLEAYADLSPLGKIDALTVDLQSQTVYAAKQSADGLCVEKLGFFQKEPQTVCTIVPTDTEPYLEQIAALHSCGDFLALLGTAQMDGESVSCFGGISLCDGAVRLYPCSGGTYAMAAFDGGAYFYDVSKPTGSIYRLDDAAETEITLINTAESRQVFVSQSGAYFATCVKTAPDTAEITVYNADGRRITKSVSHESKEITDDVRMYFDEEANRLLYCAAADDWREILF